MSITRWRLSTQLLIVLIGMPVLTIIPLLLLVGSLANRVVQAEGTERLGALAETAADLVGESLAERDIPAMNRILAATVREEGLSRVAVLMPDGSLIAEQLDEHAIQMPLSEGARGFAGEVFRTGEPHVHNDIDNQVAIAVPITVDDQVVGVLLGQASNQGTADEINETIIPELSIAAAVMGGLAIIVALLFARMIATPLYMLANRAIAIGKGQLDSLSNPGGSAEVTTLAHAFDQMVDNLRTTRAAVEEQQRTLETHVQERTTDLERTLAELREMVDSREQLSAIVREISSPVIPVFDDILVMPLIGTIDSARGQLLIDTLLQAIEHHRANTVILDVTGVPVIDSQIARILVDAARATRLLGAQMILVGLRPELAQTIVGLGLDLSELQTQADLQSGVRYAMQKRAI